MQRSQTDRDEVREGKDQSFVGLLRIWGVLFPGAVLRLLGLGWVVVVEVLVRAL